MKQLTFDQLRSVQMSILDKVHDFCQQHQLNYSLAGGSLLGAIRHKGYIPWDDDIDIMMPRDDYEYLLENFTADYPDFTFFNLQSEPNPYPFLFSKLSLNGSEISNGRIKGVGINIDIFPIDSLGQNEAQAKLRFSLMKVFNLFPRVQRSRKERTNPVVNALFRLFQRLIKFVPTPWFLLAIQSLCSNRLVSEKGFAVSIGSSYLSKELCEASLYHDYTQVEFEDRHYQSIARYDDYLSMIYGDYMQIPKKQDRENHDNVGFIQEHLLPM
ncbi:LicD family protein [Vibrio rotiferianus]|uniref:LicD family protein n=1 Tax=Vibrio rotiferianus TaxID=190895 RepID=UPI00406A79C2